MHFENSSPRLRNHQSIQHNWNLCKVLRFTHNSTTSHRCGQIASRKKFLPFPFSTFSTPSNSKKRLFSNISTRLGAGKKSMTGNEFWFSCNCKSETKLWLLQDHFAPERALHSYWRKYIIGSSSAEDFRNKDVEQWEIEGFFLSYFPTFHSWLEKLKPR